MASKTNSKIGKPVTYFSSITVSPMRLISQDIANWVRAIDAARNPLNPRRRLLNQLFDNIRSDGKIVTVEEKIKASITNKQFVFYMKDKVGDTVDRIQDEIINTTWFDEMLENLALKKFNGHLLMEIIPGIETPIGGIAVIPPDNVLPERGELLINYTDMRGIPYKGENADPLLARYLLEFGKEKDYGLLLSAAQYVIYKRGGFGDWAQCAELFGMPFRWGEYDPFDPTTRDKLLTALKEMGGAGYAVIPQGTSLHFSDTNTTAGQSAIFSELIKECNSEIAQIFLGGTMTTEDGSSKSQSETHLEGENAISKSDLKKILKWLNNTFKKRLIEFGYSEVANGSFDVIEDENIAKKDKIVIDTLVAEQVEIEPSYWYETYKVQMPVTGPKAKIKPVTPNPAAPATEDKKKSKLNLAINNFYASACNHITSDMGAFALSSEDDALRLAKLIYNNKLATGDIDKKLLKQTANKLLDGIFTENVVESIGDELRAQITENIYIFSGFKTYQQLKDASALLLDENGEVRSFESFKTEVLALDKTYNTVYLAAEYNFAVASGQMAVKWNDFQKDKKNLKYSTAVDSHVRPQHAVLDGTTLPYDAPFWVQNWPPLDWGCRCDVDQTEDTTITDLSSIKMPDRPKMFKNNTGITGKVFTEDHPYFDTSAATAKRVTETALKLISKK